MRWCSSSGARRIRPRRFAAINRDHLEAHLRSITIYAVFFPVGGGADRGGDGAAALVRRAPRPGRDAHRRRPGGVHPVHPALLPAAAGPLREVQPAAERHGVVGAGLRAARRAGDGARSPPCRCRCPARSAATSASKASGSATAPDGPWVLRDVSFTASPGQTIALVGHTGAGKTTIVNLLLRFYDPDRGRITVDGVDIRELSTADLRAIIGFVQQDLFLFTGDILHNLTLDAPITPEAAREAARRVGADRFIERLPVGLSARARRAGPEPQRRRAAAPELRPGAGARSPDPGARRGDELGGRRGRGPDPAGDRGADGRAGPASWSRTGSAPSCMPTRSWCCTTARSGSGAATGSCWRSGGSTSGSTSSSCAARSARKIA